MTHVRELINIKDKWNLMQSTLLNLIFIQKIKIKIKWRLVQTAVSTD